MPTRAPVPASRSARRLTCALYGATTSTSLERELCDLPVLVDPRTSRARSAARRERRRPRPPPRRSSGCRRARRRRTTGRCRRSPSTPTSAWCSRPAFDVEPALVEQLRRERADRSAPAATSRAGRCRGRAGSSGARRARARSAETSTPSGWLPFCGCSSCCGSPSSTMLSRGCRHGERRWPATSGPPRPRTARPPHAANSGRAQSHAVPPSTSTSADRRAHDAPRRCRRSPRSHRRWLVVLVVALVPQRAPCARLLRRARARASSRLRITLWLVAVTPTSCPARPARRSSARRCTSCPSPAGPGWRGRCRRVDRRRRTAKLDALVVVRLRRTCPTRSRGGVAQEQRARDLRSRRRSVRPAPRPRRRSGPAPPRAPRVWTCDARTPPSGCTSACACPFLHVDGPSRRGRPRRPRRTSLRRELQLGSSPDLHLLRRVAVAIDDGARRLPVFLLSTTSTRSTNSRPATAWGSSSRSSSASRAAGSTPTTRLVLAPMPVEQVGEQPPRLLLVVSASARPSDVRRAVARAALRVRCCSLARASLDGSGVSSTGRGTVGARCIASARSRLQPVAQSQRRDAVVAVVALDRVAHAPAAVALDASELERVLDRAQARPGVRERHVAREAVERLEVLDRVALDAGAQPLAHDGVEIDEALGAQQPSSSASRVA